MTPEIQGALRRIIETMSMPERGQTTLETLRNAIRDLAYIVLELGGGE